MISVAAAPALPQAARGFDGYVVTSDSARLYARVLGRGSDTIIFVHGGPGGDMTGIVPDFGPLIARHTVIFYDQRGGGRSELPADTARLFVARQVADLDEIRRYFHVERATLVAHSYGPVLAAAYALAHPTAVRRMVFIGGLPPWRANVFARTESTFNARLDAGQRARAADAAKRMADPAADTKQACRDYWAVLLRPRFSEPVRMFKEHPVDLCQSDARALRYGWNTSGRVVTASFGQWDFRERLRTLAMPTLVIHGEQDAIPMDMVEAWATYLPRAEMLRVPNAAHFPYSEQPDVVWPAIERFLAKPGR
jgi:proline iminopeptidase